MAETPTETVQRVYREFKRYTGDSLPNEPVGAPLPVGDPASGVWNPKKADLRQALLAPVAAGNQAVIDATEQAVRAETAAGASESDADRAQTYAAMLSADKVKFNTVSALIADTSMGYADDDPTPAIIVGPSDIIEAQGFRYEVAASDATGDRYVENAGGVKLRVSDLFLSPEQYGAKGDGSTNDTTAFQKLNAELAARGGGVVRMREGATYIAGRQIFGGGSRAYQHEPVIQVYDLNYVDIDGQGATIKFADGLRFGAFDPITGEPYDPPSMPFTDYTYRADQGFLLDIRRNQFVQVKNLFLDGNSPGIVLGGFWGDVSRQVFGDGLYMDDNVNQIIDNVHSRYCGRDGIYIRRRGASALGTSKITNFSSDFCSRQAMSFTGGTGDFVENGSLTNTGYGPFTNAPGVGLDIEPEGGGVVRDATFNKVRIANNRSGNVYGQVGDSADVTFIDCDIEGYSQYSVFVTRPGYRFLNCHVIGAIVSAAGGAPGVRTVFEGCFIEDYDHPEWGQSYKQGDFLVSVNSAGALFDDCDIVSRWGEGLWLVNGAIAKNCRVLHTGNDRDNRARVHNVQGGVLDGTVFSDAISNPPVDGYYILINSSTVARNGVRVEGPNVKWQQATSGAGALTGPIPDTMLDDTRVPGVVFRSFNPGNSTPVFVPHQNFAALPSGETVVRGQVYWYRNPSAAGKAGAIVTTAGVIGSTAVTKDFAAIDA